MWLLLYLSPQRAFREAGNYGEKSDILRYEILEQLGGVYVDIDMECVKPFDNLIQVRSAVALLVLQESLMDGMLHQRFAFVVGVSNTGCVEINNAVIAARPGHPIVSRLIETIHKRANQPQLDASMLARIARMGGADVAQHLGVGAGASASASAPMSTIERTGPGLMTRTFMEAIGWTSEKTAPSTRHEGFLSTHDQERVVALPVDVLYPLANNMKDAAKREARAFPPPTLAVHHWARTWQTPAG
jgi:hypothetical protein